MSTLVATPLNRGPRETPHKSHLTLALVVIAMAQLMIVLDATIVNIALPHIQTTLHFSHSSLRGSSPRTRWRSVRCCCLVVAWAT